MKKLTIIFLAFLPILAMAQSNIKKAFDQLAGAENAITSESHSLSRDAQTGAKTSQCDIYHFKISKKQESLLKNIQKAFHQDNADAYSTASGAKDRSNRGLSLAVGDANTGGVSLGSEDGMSYIYACFLDPEDTAGNHRYAYAMEWKSAGDNFVGKLAITYATTLQYRQNKYNQQHFSQTQTVVTRNGKKIVSIGGENGVSITTDILDEDFLADISELEELGNGVWTNSKSVMVSAPPTWFEKFTGYLSSLDAQGEAATNRAIASKLYQHTKDLKCVDARDRETARELLKTILADKAYTSDAIVNELLNAAMVNIK